MLFRSPLPVSAGEAREWNEVLNTDAEQYGGSGVGNFGRVGAIDEPMWGQPAHAVLRLPPLGVLWLEPASPVRTESTRSEPAGIEAAEESLS